MSRLAELSSHLQSQLKVADWATKREIIRAVVQRIEIGPTKVAVVLRLPTEASALSLEPIVVTLSRVWADHGWRLVIPDLQGGHP
jgi:hypothetical protein